MIMRLKPKAERLLNAVYVAELEHPEKALTFINEPKWQSLGFDDREEYLEIVRKLEEAGYLRDATNEISVQGNLSYFHLRLTGKGREYCEHNKLI